MWEFEIENNVTKEREYIHGYSFKDALRRCKLNEDEWKYICREYID